jgi:hypothetical protein
VGIVLKEDLTFASKEQKVNCLKLAQSQPEYVAKIQLVLNSLILLGIAQWLMLIKIWLFHSVPSKKVNADHPIFINSETLLIKLQTLQSKVWQKERSVISK